MTTKTNFLTGAPGSNSIIWDGQKLVRGLSERCDSSESAHYNHVSALLSFETFGQKKAIEIKMEDFFHTIQVSIINKIYFKI